MKNQIDKPVDTKRRLKIAFLSVVAILLLSVGSFAAYAFYVQDRILPHTQVAGVHVGGLTKDEALTKLANKEALFKDSELAIRYQDKGWQLPVSSLQIAVEYQSVIEEAFRVGKEGSFTDQVTAIARSLVSTKKYDAGISDIPDKGMNAFYEAILKEIEVNATETSLDLVPGRVTIKPGKSGQKLDDEEFKSDLTNAFATGKPTIALKLTTFEPKVATQYAENARAQAAAILASDWKLSTPNAHLDIPAKDIAKLLSVEVREASSHTGSELRLKWDTEVLKKTLADFAATNDRPANNAQLKVTDGVLAVSTADKDGLSLDIDESLKLFNQAFTESSVQHELVGVTKVVKADLREDTIASLGIKELIGKATTDFSGSPTNRKLNIARGQQSLNGSLVKNGDVFSTIQTLGPIEESTGYLPELVIKDNRTTPEAGGGLCQVSTTLFRSVLNAGLPIVERTNHSYRVGYYERSVGPGLDATIYDPNPDFKWKNDTGNSVYVQSYIVGNQITFELYGTSDGRVATIGSPQILETIPVTPSIYVNTDTLYKGETKQIETAHDGAKTSVDYVVKRGGQEINKQIFKSYYKPWPAQYLVGTKERPAA